jgi:hypothetical protein
LSFPQNSMLHYITRKCSQGNIAISVYYWSRKQTFDVWNRWLRKIKYQSTTIKVMTNECNTKKNNFIFSNKYSRRCLCIRSTFWTRMAVLKQIQSLIENIVKIMKLVTVDQAYFHQFVLIVRGMNLKSNHET